MNAAESKRIQAENDQFAPDYPYYFPDFGALVNTVGERNGLIVERVCGHRRLRIKVCACGPGTDLIWLAQRGHELEASDISPRMLGEAQELITARKLNIPLSEANVLNLSAFPKGKFDAVTLLGNSIAYLLTESDLLQASSQARSLLSKRGHFFVGFRDYEQWLANARPGMCAADGFSRFSDGDGLRTVHQIWQCIDGRTYSTTVHIHRQTSSENRCHAHTMTLLRAWTKDEVGKLLEKSGFRVTFEALPHRSIALDGFDQLLAVAAI